MTENFGCLSQFTLRSQLLYSFLWHPSVTVRLFPSSKRDFHNLCSERYVFAPLGAGLRRPEMLSDHRTHFFRNFFYIDVFFSLATWTADNEHKKGKSWTKDWSAHIELFFSAKTCHQFIIPRPKRYQLWSLIVYHFMNTGIVFAWWCNVRA